MCVSTIYNISTRSQKSFTQSVVKRNCTYKNVRKHYKNENRSKIKMSFLNMGCSPLFGLHKHSSTHKISSSVFVTQHNMCQNNVYAHT